jgi:serine phosphatase RsbU (regulator of sigma subunit)
VLVGVVVAGAVFGSRAVAVTALLVAATIALDVAFGRTQLIAGLTPGEALIVIKLQLGVFTMAGLVVAAEAHELELASHEAAAATARATDAESNRRLEHQIALTLQKSLLPRHPAQNPSVSIAARYEAGSEAMIIGGDWYDVIELTDNRIGFTIGDVVGHGLEAATAMSKLRTAISVLANHFQSPSELLTNLDRYARGINHIDFATANYAILDTGTGLFTFASAGHPPMLLVTPAGDTMWLEEGRSPPLHGEPVTTRPEASVHLEPGTLMIGYTDGLVERRSEDITAGLDRLQAVAVNIRSESVAEICDLLIAKMGVAQAREDDVVILVIRYDPASGGTAPLTTVNRQAPREAAATGSSGSAGVGG